MIVSLTPDSIPQDAPDSHVEGVTGATELPVVILAGQVAFPRISQPLQVTDPASLWALERLRERTQNVLLLQSTGDAQDADLYTVGTVCTLVRQYMIPSGGYSALFKGQERAQVIATEREGEGLVAMIAPLNEAMRNGPELEALRRTLSTQIHEYAEKSNQVAPEVVSLARRITHAGYLADLAAAKLVEDPEQQQQLLEELDVYERMFAVTALLNGWIRTLDVRSSIQSQIQEGIESAQRNFYLKEQLRTIQRELGIANAVGDEREELLEAIAGSQMPEAVRARATKEIERLEGISPASPELAVVRNYIDTLLDLPWQPARRRRRVGLKSARGVLDRHHFGLEKVKKRVIEYLAVRSLTDESQSPILCLVGPPGVGKTSLGRAISQAVRRRYIRVSLGGVRDEAEIRGHRRTYVGALPGRIIQGMARAGTLDPVFVLDEVDKIGRDFRGDPSSALLEALDPEHNRNFSDHYLEVGYDLSQVMFLLTANNEWGIPPTLRDRLEIIRLEGYTAREKMAIAKGHLVPRQLKDHGLAAGGRNRLRISDEALAAIVQRYTREAGVRELERRIAAVCRKVARRRAAREPTHRVVRVPDLRELLGPAPYADRSEDTSDRVGVVNGLAVTAHGGELLPVEAAWSRGKREFLCTGNLGDVMAESAQAALSYVTQHAGSLGFQPNVLTDAFVHLHVPEGAVPKDGPSAGIAMGTALASAFLGRSVRGDLAMTGEVTIQGRVLPIGGVKEKVLAAQRHGIREVILPSENRSEVGEIPADVRRKFKFTFVDSMDQVLATALSSAPYSDRRTQ